MTSHTPGPWFVRFRADGSCYISIGDHRTGPHKQFDLQLERCRDNDEDDARLISAAPELLEALSIYLAVVGNTGYALSRESAAELYEKASAAIAKATGATP